MSQFGLSSEGSARLPRPRSPQSPGVPGDEMFLWSQQEIRNWLEANPQPPPPVVYLDGVAHDTGGDQAVVDAITSGTHKCGPRCTLYGDKHTDPGYGPCRESWPWVRWDLVKPRPGQLAQPHDAKGSL